MSLPSIAHGDPLYNPVNDPTLPPFSKILTWTAIDQRLEATDYWKQKIRSVGDNARYHHHLAPLLGEVGDTRGELKHHRLAVGYNPSSANCRNDYGLALYKQGKFKEAAEQYELALRIQPDHIVAMNNFAACLCKLGDFNRATLMCESALEFQPDHAMTLRNLAKILDTRGNTRDAVKYNRKAIANGPGRHGVTEHADTMTYRNLARQLVARGQTEKGHALEHYDTYRSLAGKVNVLPNSEKTRELMERTKTKW